MENQKQAIAQNENPSSRKPWEMPFVIVSTQVQETRGGEMYTRNESTTGHSLGFYVS